MYKAEIIGAVVSTRSFENSKHLLHSADIPQLSLAKKLLTLRIPRLLRSKYKEQIDEDDLLQENEFRKSSHALQ